MPVCSFAGVAGVSCAPGSDLMALVWHLLLAPLVPKLRQLRWLAASASAALCARADMGLNSAAPLLCFPCFLHPPPLCPRCSEFLEALRLADAGRALDQVVAKRRRVSGAGASTAPGRPEDAGDESNESSCSEHSG